MAQRFEKNRGRSGPSSRPGGKKPSQGRPSGGKSSGGNRFSSDKPSGGKPGSFRSGSKPGGGGPQNKRRGPNKPDSGGDSSLYRGPKSSGPGSQRDRRDQGKHRPARSSDTGQPKATPRTRRRISLTPDSNLDLPAWITKPGMSMELSSTTVQDLFTHLELKEENNNLGRLLDHLLLVKQMNEEINLVSRANVELVLLQSLWECLVPTRDLSWRVGNRILDLGTGGGFPGIPLAVMLPDAQLTLIDSRRAKTLALRNIIDELKLENVTIVHDRAETYAQHEGRSFDTVVVRAVGMLKEVAPWAASLLRDGGTVLAWKGPEGIREFNELDKSLWTLAGNIPVLPHRSVMVLRYNAPA